MFTISTREQIKRIFKIQPVERKMMTTENWFGNLLFIKFQKIKSSATSRWICTWSFPMTGQINVPSRCEFSQKNASPCSRSEWYSVDPSCLIFSIPSDLGKVSGVASGKAPHQQAYIPLLNLFSTKPALNTDWQASARKLDWNRLCSLKFSV